MKIPAIQYDKALHFIYGAAIAVAVMYLMMIFGFHRDVAKGTGFLAAILIGSAKEGIDHLLNKRAIAAGKPVVHTVSGMDAVATAVGGLLVWIA